MTFMKTLKQGARWSAVAACFALALPVLAGRPLTIDDAEPVDPGGYELEAGLLFSKAPGERHRDLPLGLSYGLAPGLEIGAGWGLHMRDRLDANADAVRGQQDFLLGFKWMPVHSAAGFRLALAGGVKFGTASRAKGLGTGDKDVDLTLIATQQWQRLALDVNLGRTWVGRRYDPGLADNVHYGAALRYPSSDKLTWVGEVFADDALGSKAQWQTNAGVQYAWRKNLVLDGAIGRRLSSAGPDWVLNVGFTASY
jgi:Putative MetA-pathway of phenol degradation